MYSSEVGDYVPVTSAAYLAFRAEGRAPNRVPDEAELGEALREHRGRPTNAGVLDGVREALSRRVAATMEAKVLFNHENRIRALEGSAPITPAQFRNALKNLM